MQVKIEKLDHLGRGIAYIDGKVVFVPKSVVGDILDINITSEKKNYSNGIIKSIIKPSLDRKEAKCPYFLACGGCDLQTLNYDKTLEYKKNNIINIFKRINVDINPKVISNSHEYNYRNKIELKIVNEKIGYFSANSYDLVPINNCLISFNCLNKVLKTINLLNIENGNITLRSNLKEEVLVIINTKDSISIDKFLKTNSNIIGIILNNKTIYGKNIINETIDAYSFQYSYNSFFQINPYITKELFSIINSNIDKNDKVLDLYCGVGTLSIVAAKKAKEVLGIEIVPNAIKDATVNAKLNKINNITFITSDVIRKLDTINKNYNTIIVDPPRNGLDTKLIDKIIENKPQKIIYVSCNSQTLVRDLKTLLNDYSLKDIYLLDMFSYTYHSELVCILQKK